MPRIKYTKEVVFKKFDDLTKKGIKLTRSSLDSVDPKLYISACQLFDGSWMECKKAYYAYQEESRNPEKNLEKIVVNKVQAIEQSSEIKISEEDKLNPDFVKYLEENEGFIAEIILNTFETWENFYSKYDELSTPEEPEFTEEEIVQELTTAISSDDLIEENAFSKKYSDIYNAIVKQYGSLKEGLVHFLNKSTAK